MTVRERIEQQEKEILSSKASLAVNSRGRVRAEEPSEVRTCYQRDIDRIVHSKAFRRLKHKTQVFLEPEGDHYRTRMTHTLEVSRVARTISRGLQLNEDLTEAAALGHDLGHTPFGHAGERALKTVMPGGFSHNAQSLRTVEQLEKDGDGLNLTYEVRNAIFCHTTQSPRAETLEGRVLEIADQIAYINHDIDDAIRGGIIFPMDIPLSIKEVLGYNKTERINNMVIDVIQSSEGKDDILQSPEFAEQTKLLKQFLLESVYTNPVAKGEEGKAQEMLLQLFRYYRDHPDALPDDFQNIRYRDGAERAACDYIAGMTDTYAIYKFHELFIPKGWTLT